jgi:hypothetical protein
MIEHDNSLPMPPGTGPGAAVQPAPDPGVEDLLCLNGPAGPCTYLWQFQTNFRHGNPAGTFSKGQEPRHNRNVCLCGTEEMDLEAAAVFACNRYQGGCNKLVQLRTEGS